MFSGELWKNSPTVTLRAGCKVNLYLYLTGIRENGYHELESIFLPLKEPFDLIHVCPGKHAGLEFSCAQPWLDPQNNTLVKAYNAFAALSGFSPGLEVKLEKGIPSGAGLGGGSSDAATLLLYLNSVAPSPLSMDELTQAALKVGADVPFFLRNTASTVSGIGEKVEPCPMPLLNMILLLICPNITVSTPKAYRRYDEIIGAKSFKPRQEYLTSWQSKYKKGGLRLPCLANDLEQAVFIDYPCLRELKAVLLGLGAAAALMSGSGASIFALFRDASRAETARAHMMGRGLKVYTSSL